MIEKSGRNSELDELLEAAMYKEVASQTLYLAGQKLTSDPGAISLMKELAEEETQHLKLLKRLKERGLSDKGYYLQKVPNLMLSQYLKGGDSLEGAGLQDTLTFAIKREQQSLEFYANMMGSLKDKSAKQICQRLAKAELSHKYKLESMYDDLFFQED
jgi:rubrerythrin